MQSALPINPKQTNKQKANDKNKQFTEIERPAAQGSMSDFIHDFKNSDQNKACHFTYQIDED